MGVDFSTNMAYIIDMFGSSATLKRKTSNVNKYGDDAPTYKSETITVGVNDFQDEESFEKYGVHIQGDRLFFIKASVTTPNEGDEIIYRSDTYEITGIRSPDSGELSHHECVAKIV